MSQYFESAEANRNWDSYFRRVDRALDRLPSEEAGEIRAELEAHAHSLFEGMEDGDVVAALERALQKLGEPEDYVAAIAADWWLTNANSNRTVSNVLKAIFFNIGSGIRRSLIAALLSLGLLFSASLVFVGVLKLFLWDQVGLFLYEDSGFSFGWVPEHGASNEVLGIGFIPISFALAWGLYRIVSKLLVSIRK